LDASSNNRDVTKIGEQIVRIKEDKDELLLRQGTLDNSKQRIDEMIQFLDEQDVEIKEFNEVLIRRMVEEVRVFDENVTIKFKSGIEVKTRG